MLSSEQKDLWVLGKTNLDFKKTEIPLFHNVRLKVNGKSIILERSINELMVNDFRDVGSIFTSFIELGLLQKGFDLETLPPPEVVSFELAEPISQFEQSEHRDLRVLKYGKDNRRDLGFIGYENYYDYVDNSNGLEYEIQFFNRNQKTIPQIIRDLEFLTDLEPIDIVNDISNIEPFRISFNSLKNDFLLEYEINNEINGLYGYRYRSKQTSYIKT